MKTQGKPKQSKQQKNKQKEQKSQTDAILDQIDDPDSTVKEFVRDINIHNFSRKQKINLFSSYYLHIIINK